MKLIILNVLLIFGSSWYGMYAMAQDGTTIMVKKTSLRKGRTPSQCYYFSRDSEKIDSVGLDGSLDTCVPYTVLKEIRKSYQDEYGNNPAIVNFGKVHASKSENNQGLNVGLYYFYLGHVSHASLYKVLILRNKIYTHVKRGDSGNKVYADQFNEFQLQHAKSFNRKTINEIRDSFLRGIDDW